MGDNLLKFVTKPIRNSHNRAYNNEIFISFLIIFVLPIPARVKIKTYFRGIILCHCCTPIDPNPNTIYFSSLSSLQWLVGNTQEDEEMTDSPWRPV